MHPPFNMSAALIPIPATGGQGTLPLFAPATAKGQSKASDILCYLYTAEADGPACCSPQASSHTHLPLPPKTMHPEISSSFTYVSLKYTGKYLTSVSYRKLLVYLLKEDLVNCGLLLGQRFAKSWTKDVLMDKLASYVFSHPENVLDILYPDEILLISDLVKKGPEKGISKRIGQKYDTMLRLVLVKAHSNRNGSYILAMPDDIRELFAPLIPAYAKKAKESSGKTLPKGGSPSLPGATKSIPFDDILKPEEDIPLISVIDAFPYRDDQNGE